MSVFPLLIVFLLMTLIAELVVIGPRALRSALRGEEVKIQAASARALLVLLSAQILLVVGWALLLRGRPF